MPLILLDAIVGRFLNGLSNSLSLKLFLSTKYGSGSGQNLGTTQEKTTKSDPIYCNELVNMLVNSIEYSETRKKYSFATIIV